MAAISQDVPLSTEGDARTVHTITQTRLQVMSYGGVMSYAAPPPPPQEAMTGRIPSYQFLDGEYV